MRLEQTCTACPEQYDVWHGKRRVGYLRLRHGRFTVRFLHAGGELLYEARPKGDGIFEDSEREFYLDIALQTIRQRLREERIFGD